jgi:hypothetical protein
MTGGHGDPTLLPIGTALDASIHNAMFAICDGVPDCIKMVRLIVRQEECTVVQTTRKTPNSLQRS